MTAMTCVFLSGSYRPSFQQRITLCDNKFSNYPPIPTTGFSLAKCREEQKKVLGRTCRSSAQNSPKVCPEFGKTSRHCERSVKGPD